MNAKDNYTHTIVLGNGAVIGFWPRGDMAEIYCDLNGKQGPNRYGKDIFLFIIAKNSISNQYQYGKIEKPGLYLYGQGLSRAEYTNASSKCNYCPCTKNTNGLWCGTLIMYDGWQIKNDYPW